VVTVRMEVTLMMNLNVTVQCVIILEVGTNEQVIDAFMLFKSTKIDGICNLPCFTTRVVSLICVHIIAIYLLLLVLILIVALHTL